MAFEMDDLRGWLRSLLTVGSGQILVDVGCGWGDDLLALAAERPSARFLGIDRSVAGSASTKAANVNFLQADVARSIPLKTASVDALLSVNLLECMPDQGALIRECARVLRPGGQIVLAHFDWDTQTFDGPDRELIRRVVHSFSDWKQAWMDAIEPWTGRRLHRRFAENGEFSGDVQARTLISTSFQEGSYGRRQVACFEALVRRDMLSRHDYDCFMKHQQDAAEAGGFMFSVTMFAFVGRRLPLPAASSTSR